MALTDKKNVMSRVPHRFEHYLNDIRIQLSVPMYANVNVQNRIAERKTDRNGDLQIDATRRI